MAHTLTGIVKGMRPVAGTYSEPERKGEFWYFLSLEILDPTYGEISSCQLPETDRQYNDFVESTGNTLDNGAEERVLKQGMDWKDHKVKTSIVKQTAGERSINQRVFKAGGEKNIAREKQQVPVVRSQITNIRDLGFPEDED